MLLIPANDRNPSVEFDTEIEYEDTNARAKILVIKIGATPYEFDEAEAQEIRDFLIGEYG